MRWPMPAPTAGSIVSADLFYDRDAADNVARWQAAGAIALDLEAAAVLRVGRAARYPSGVPDRGRLRSRAASAWTHDRLLAAGERLGDTAIAALSVVRDGQPLLVAADLRVLGRQRGADRLELGVELVDRRA